MSGALIRVLTCVALAAGALAALAGCATGGPQPAAGSAGAVPLPTSAVGLEPGAALVGDWRVEAPTAPPATLVRFGPKGFTIVRDGRQIWGSWATGDDRLVASITSWEGAAGDPKSPWLTEATSFKAQGTGWILRSDDGDAIATLVAAPGVSGLPPGFTTSPTTPPEATPILSTPTPPPGAVSPVTRADLVGRWVTGTATQQQTRPGIEFRTDDSYRATDGCNGVMGRWQVVTGNRLLTTDGASTEVGCSNLVRVPEWLSRTRSVAILDDVLTLYDVDGKPVGELSMDRS